MNITKIIPSMLITLFTYIVLPSAIAQDVSSRLLPESFTKTIVIKWRQDGRSVDIDVTNPKDKWVLKELLLKIRYPVEPAPETPAQKIKSKNSNLTTQAGGVDLEAGDRFLRELDATETVMAKVEALPGHMATANIELKHTKKVSEIILFEARGREPTRFELLKAKLF